MADYHARSREFVQQFLLRYASVLSLSIEDNANVKVSHAMGAAATAVVLVSTASGLVHNLAPITIPVRNITVTSLLIVLCWLVFTFVFTRESQRKTLIPLHMHLVSFWLVVSAFFAVLVCSFISPLYGNERLFLAGLLLLICIPVHISKCKIAFKRKLIYIPALLLSNGVLVYVASTS